MFQAEAEGGDTASVSSRRSVISDTLATYAISVEQGQEKGSRQGAMNRCKEDQYV